MTPGNVPVPGSRAWWARLAEFAAVRAWCYRGLGMATEARRWQGISRDAGAQLSRAMRP